MSVKVRSKGEIISFKVGKNFEKISSLTLLATQQGHLQGPVGMQYMGGDKQVA